MKYPRQTDGFLADTAGDKGYGLFAQQSYKKDELLFRVRGKLIHHTDTRLSHRAVQQSKTKFLEPDKYSATWYLNHSCSPNAYVDMDKVIAKKKIAPGDEITVDYSLFTDFATWDMECVCSAKTCRKLIVPFKQLPAKRKNISITSSYLR